MTTILDRLRARFVRFDSRMAVNPELRVPIGEARLRVERERIRLLQQYLRGEISGYQCRVFFFNFIRDSIPLRRELEYRVCLEDDLEYLTLYRVTPPEPDEIEHVLTRTAKQVRDRRITFWDGLGRIQRLLHLLPGPEQQEYEQVFKSICRGRRLVPLPWKEFA